MELLVVEICTQTRNIAAGAAACLDSVAVLHAEQLGHTPYHIILQFVQLAIGEDDFPHEPDEGLALVIVEMALEHAGEGVKINRFVVGCLPGPCKPLQFRSTDGIVPLEGGLEPLPFHVLANAVRIDDVVEKRRRGDMRIVLPVVLCCRRTWKVHEEGKHTIEHGSHFGFSQSSLKSE